MKYLLDTNICIYIINNKPATVLDRFKTLKTAQVYISSITIAELEYGAEKSRFKEKNRQALFKFLIPLEIIPFSFSDARSYGEIRADLESRGLPIGAMDLLIAAQAISNNFVLVTNNVREFKRIRNLQFENWI